ncbi:MAG: hypothetical protein GY796_21050 [Chloroflexi bacterium]|nr:hypothetical protein [Chloroflexota bacterium]
MNHQRIVRLITLTLAFLFILGACNREEETPTPLPTAAVPATLPTATNTPIPSPTPENASGPETADPNPTPIPAADTVKPADITWPPQVIASAPLPNEELLLDGAITIRFDQPMDTATVEQAMSVAPEEGGTAVSGEFSWPRTDTLIFTPKSNLQGKQLYNVTIDEQAQGQNGRTLQTPVQFHLQTAGNLAVSQIIPADGTNGVATDGSITVLFNRPVVPLVSSGQQADLPQPLTFDPPASGQGEWTSTSIYRFMPDPPLAGATSYNISVDPNLTDVVGTSQEAAFTSQFGTLSPDVIIALPESVAPIAPDTTFTVTFNMPMDIARTEAAITLTGNDTPAADLAFNWVEDGRIVGITPQENLELDTDYQLVIGASAAAASGQATLEEQVTFPYQTHPFPAVIGVYPRAGTTAEYYDRGVTIQFASPMDWETIEGKVSIIPGPPNRRYFINEWANEVQIDFPLEPDTRYNITVPSTAADPYGNIIGAPYEWQFSTPSSPPIASFNLPQNQSQLSASFPSQVDIIHSNVAEMNAALYDLGLPLNLLNRPYDVREYNPAGAPLRNWNIPIDGRHNELSILSLPLADGGVLPTGIYLLTLDSADLSEDAQWWQNQRNLLILADTNIVVKEMFGDVHVWATDIASGQPAPNLDVALYDAQGINIGTAVTDNNGFARFDYYPFNDYLEGVTVISNNPSQAGFGVGNSNWNGNATPWQFGLESSSQDETANKAYIYTDRPIYRPGDTMYYKGIVRRANYGRYELTSPLDVNLIIRFNSFSGEDSFEQRVTATVRPDGTFNGEFLLPEDVPLGSYQIVLESPLVDYTAARNFTVAEYRRPEFLVSLTPEKTDAVRGETVDVILQAEYFFGGSAADLPVTWNISEEPYYPNFPGPYYCWSDCGNFYYEDPGFFFGGGFGGNFLASGEGVTDANGRLTITLPADLLQNVDEGSRIANIEATVQDLSNFPISSRTEVTFHAADTYVGIKAQNGFVAVGETAAVDLKTVDWDGVAAANQPIEVIFYQREWEPVRTQDFGQYYTAWNAADTEVTRQKVTTDSNGEASASFTPEAGGNYLAVATVTDNSGRVNLSSTYLWVTDDGRIAWQTDPHDATMDLIPDKQEYAVGETARILVQNPFDVPLQAWVTLERGDLLTQQVVTLQANSDVLDIPISADYSPNAFVTVTAVKPVSPDNENNPYAEVRLGIAELVVPPIPFTLNVELTPQQTLLKPRDTAVYDILTTDSGGRPISADLSLALVDLAILTLKEDNAPNIVDYFYERQPYRSQMGGGLFISGEGLEVEVPVQGGGLGGGGGDAVANEALARVPGDEEDDVRRDFPDTAYWEANIVTDADGRATVEIPLPDTLTTWRLSSKANTADTLVGQNAVDLITTLPLLIRPVTPRFLTVGDVLQLGAIINNNTNEAIEAAVTLEADGVTLHSPAEQTVNVPANGQTLVRWETAVDEAQFVNGQAFADFTFRVEGDSYSDATKPGFGVGPDKLIPIVRYNAQDIVGTSGELDTVGRRVEAILLPPGVDMDQGNVELVLSPSLAAALLDSLVVQNNLEIPAVCASSVADRLLPNVAVASLINRLDVPEVESQYGAELDVVITTSISQLQEMVKADGGWGWCYSAESQPWLTAYVLLGLTKARQIGYKVPESLLENGGDYLVAQLEQPASFRQPSDANQQAFFLYVLAEMGADVNGELDNMFNEARGLLDPYAKALLLMGYRITDGDANNVQALISDLNDSAVLSATGAHWEDASTDFGNLSSDIRGTAMIIDALTLHEPDNLLAAPAVRWLMAARTAAHWPTMHETAWSIFALTEWLAETGELDANYDYGLQVNLQPTADGRFTPDNITESRPVAVPVPGLAQTDPNYFEFRRGEGDGRLYYTMHLNTAIDASQVAASNQGIRVERAYYDAACDPEIETCDPISQIEAGQQVRVVVTVNTENDLLYTVIEDPIPSGAEAVDPNLDTTPSEGGSGPVPFDYKPGYWGWWYFNRVEFRDDKVVFLADFLPAGTYQYTYFLDTVIPGEYQVMPTFAKQEYFPEVNGRADGLLFTINEE